MQSVEGENVIQSVETNLRPIALVAAVAAIFVSVSASAGENVGPRKVLDVGCHNTNGICYVTLDGSAFGATLGCPSAPTKEFRFDNGDTIIGRRAYASFLAALMSGKSVSVYLEGCTSQGAPNLIYFHVAN
jgi:hypothetical protein